MHDLDRDMQSIRTELTAITQALTSADAEHTPLLQQQRTQLMTRLRQLELRRWFTPTPTAVDPHSARNRRSVA